MIRANPQCVPHAPGLMRHNISLKHVRGATLFNCGERDYLRLFQLPADSHTTDDSLDATGAPPVQ